MAQLVMTSTSQPGRVHSRSASIRAAVSAPLDLVETSRALERLRTLPYRAYVLRALVRQGREFARTHPSRATYDSAALLRLRTVRAYDEAVVAPM